MTLNLCRLLAYGQEGKILSKKTDWKWGIAVLPSEYQEFVGQALATASICSLMGENAAAEDFQIYQLADYNNIYSQYK